MSDLLKRKSAAMNAFTKIGRTNGSSPPESTTNNFAEAYEFAIAASLRSAANARYDAAKEAAIMAGVFKAEYTPGKHNAFNKDGVIVIASRNKDGETLDSGKLKNELTKKLGADKAEALLSLCMKPKKGALSFEVILEGSE